MPASSFRIILLISTLLITLFFTCCKRGTHNHNVEITLKIKGSRGEMVYLEKVTLEGTVLLDSLPADKQGEVSFSLYTTDFEFVMVGNKSARNILLVAQKDQEIMVYTDSGQFGEEYSVQGSPGSTLLQELEQQKLAVLRQLDSIGQVWLKERYIGDHVQQKALFDSLSEAVILNHTQWLTGQIEKYSESPAMIVAIYQTLQPGTPVFTLEEDLSLFETVASTLSPLYPVNEHVRDLARRIDDFKEDQKAFLERERQLQPGLPAPSFSLFNTSGEKITLESYLGKMVLLYFWDARKRESWDVNKQLADLHRQYRSQGFEILGIYTGEDKQLYFSAIQIDGLPWVHLLGNTHTINLYNVKEAPTMLLIDRDGTVLHRSVTVAELTAKLPWILPVHAGTPSATSEPEAQ